MNEMKEAVGNWREAKQFSPADENDFLRWLDKADTEEARGILDALEEEAFRVHERIAFEDYD